MSALESVGGSVGHLRWEGGDHVTRAVAKDVKGKGFLKGEFKEKGRNLKKT